MWKGRLSGQASCRVLEAWAEPSRAEPYYSHGSACRGSCTLTKPKSLSLLSPFLLVLQGHKASKRHDTSNLKAWETAGHKYLRGGWRVKKKIICFEVSRNYPFWPDISFFWAVAYKKISVSFLRSLRLAPPLFIRVVDDPKWLIRKRGAQPPQTKELIVTCNDDGSPQRFVNIFEAWYLRSRNRWKHTYLVRPHKRFTEFKPFLWTMVWNVIVNDKPALTIFPCVSVCFDVLGPGAATTSQHGPGCQCERLSGSHP